MNFHPTRALVATMGLCCVAVTTFSCRHRTSGSVVPALASSPAQRLPLTLDQANIAAWTNAWTNLVNDVRQTFTPSLPKLVAVEVELVVGNPGHRTIRSRWSCWTRMNGQSQLCRRPCQQLTVSTRDLFFEMAAWKSRPGNSTVSD